VVQGLFGYFDGALNAFPKGTFLSKCGINLKASRQEFDTLTYDLENRDLIEVIEKIYNIMGYSYDITFYCYYGTL
jgi:hypothetical protein